MLITLFCGKKENGDLNFGGELIIMRKLGKTGSVQLCLNDAEEGKEGCPWKAILKIVTGTKTRQSLLKCSACFYLQGGAFESCPMLSTIVFSIHVRSPPWAQKWNKHDLWSYLAGYWWGTNSCWPCFHQLKKPRDFNWFWLKKMGKRGSSSVQKELLWKEGTQDTLFCRTLLEKILWNFLQKSSCFGKLSTKVSLLSESFTAQNLRNC